MTNVFDNLRPSIDALTLAFLGLAKYQITAAAAEFVQLK